MKKLNRSVLAAFILILIGALLVGGATLALFTDTAVNTGNSFAAGELSIDLDKANGDLYFNIGNIAPGDSGSANILVTNSGSLELRYRFNDLDKVGYLLTGGSHPIVFTLKAEDNTIISTGAAGTPYILNPGASNTITIEWVFPLDAGNEYQGTTGTLGISVNAEQTKNN